MDHDQGAPKSSPEDIAEIDNVLKSLSSHEISAQTKINIMQPSYCWKMSYVLASVVRGFKFYLYWSQAVKFL